MLALPIILLICGMANAADSPPLTIADVPAWDWRNYKVDPFMRAAAKFQALGKEKACALLSEIAHGRRVYDRLQARFRASGLTGEALEVETLTAFDKDREHYQGLFILCRMLFTAKVNGEFRRPALGFFFYVGPDWSVKWPLEPIEIVDGVPFLVVTGGALGGLPESPQMYLDYCIKNCDWNAYQFKPKSPEEQKKSLKKLLASLKLEGISAEDKELLAAQIDRPDIVLADFEGDTYPAGWKTTGTAFGKGPAKGTLPNQMPVSGFLGKGLVNSYLGGDGSTGTLTSPAFKIERKYLNFLIGGGQHPKTRIDLLYGGKVVRTATGPNDRPGGTEHLDWHTWDVSNLVGEEVRVEIVDGETGGWGHINIDNVVQSDKKKAAEPFTADFTIHTRYLHLPVKTGAPMRRMKFIVDKQVVREFDIELDTSAKPQFWAFADVSAFKGKRLTVSAVLPADSRRPDFVESDDVPDAEKLYREKHRPLFHFTSRFGWLNDPNGLVYHDGEWHLFYQHNPFGVNWGNMHWAHAVSPDLVHWKELGIGLYPKKYGDWAFSGSAVVDKGNTSGWGTKEKPPLVLAYTSTGRGECIAFSNDKGRNWTEYDQNPVVKHQGRDPKLIWYEKGKHWVMAVYDEHDKKQWIAFYTSPDLKKWTFASRIDGFFECPDLFKLNVSKYAIDDPEAKWVLYAADGKYLIGDFDGKQFKPDQKGKKQLWYGNFYAAQTFDDGVGRRPGSADLDIGSKRIQVGWSQGVTFPGMPFNQQMTTPVYLVLCKGVDRAKPDELSLTANPVHELWGLREVRPVYDLQGGQNQVIAKATALADGLDAFDAWLSIEVGQAKGFTLDLRGTKLIYDAEKQTLSCNRVTAPLKPHNGIVAFRILVDRGSVEVFAAESAMAMSIAAIPDEKNRKLQVIPQGGEVTIRAGNVYRMKSAWRK